MLPFVLVAVVAAADNSTQRLALMDLWTSNGGALWSGASGWGSERWHCTWQGVQCYDGNATVSNSTVAAISLSTFGLEGTLSLPASFANLSLCTMLDASSNAITDLVVASDQLPALLYLNLIGNAFAALPSAVTRMPSLEVLFLTSNRIARVDAASFLNQSMPRLTLLYLDSNAIGTFDGAVLQLLPALGGLVLKDNQLAAFPFVAHPRLQNLILDGNQRLASLDGVALLAGLQIISADGCRLRLLPSSLPVNVTEIHVASNVLTALPDALCRCVKLGVLNVANNHISALPPCVATLARMYSLLMANNDLTALPDGLSNLRLLDSLDVQKNAIANLPADLLSWPNCTGLQHLLLSENLLADFDFSGNFHALVELDISRNVGITRIPGGVDAALMPNLVDLDASHCSIAALPPLSALASLGVVDLSDNAIAFSANGSAVVDDLCNPLAAQPQPKCRIHIVRLSNNRMRASPDLSCCAQLDALFLDGNAFALIPAWIPSLRSLRSLSIGSNLTDSALAPLESLQQRLELLDLSFNSLVFPPALIFSGIAEQLLLSHNRIRAIPDSAWPSFFFNGTRWIDVSDNELLILPPFYTIWTGAVPTLTLRTLKASNNRLSGRVPFIPVDTLTLAGNPGMRVPGEQLNARPLSYDSGSVTHQLLSADDPFVFVDRALQCQTIYRQRQIVVVTGHPALWEVVTTSAIDLDASYFSFQHCQCRATFFGFVDERGDAACVSCQTAFAPLRTARCEAGGSSLSFIPDVAPVFKCAEHAHDPIELAVDRLTRGGAGCVLVAFEPCKVDGVCNVDGTSASVTRSRSQDDDVTGALCAEGHTGRLCAECAFNDTLAFYHNDGRCDVCPELPLALIVSACCVAFVLIGALFVSLPVRARRFWPLLTLLILAALGVVLYVRGQHAVVFGEVISLALSLVAVLMIGERRRRIDALERKRKRGGEDRSNAGLKITLFFLQTLAAVGADTFPRTAATVSGASFARPSSLGLSCLLHYIDPALVAQEPTIKRAVGLSIPLVFAVSCVLALALRDVVDKCRKAPRRAPDDNDPLSGVPPTIVAKSRAARLIDAVVGPLLGEDDEEDDGITEPLGAKIKRVVVALLHVSFFGSFKAIVSVVSCETPPHSDLLSGSSMQTARFMHSEPAIVCSTASSLYADNLIVAAAFACIYIVAFPAVLIGVMWRHRKSLQANGVMLSPLTSSVNVAAAVRDDITLGPKPWYGRLLHGWSKTQPFAELFWLMRRAALALALALLGQDPATQGVGVVLVLGGSLFLQRTLRLFEERLDEQLDTMALWAIIVTFVYSRLSRAEANEWSILGVAVLVLDGTVLLIALFAMLRREWALKISSHFED
jgi:Leucine-rich repeat (LRR) protein